MAQVTRWGVAVRESRELATLMCRNVGSLPLLRYS